MNQTTNENSAHAESGEQRYYLLSNPGDPIRFPYKGPAVLVAAVFVILFVGSSIAVLWSDGLTILPIIFTSITVAGSAYVIWTTVHLAVELAITDDAIEIRKGKDQVTIPWSQIGAFRAVPMYGGGGIVFFKLKPTPGNRLPVARFYVQIGSLMPLPFDRLKELIALIERHTPRERSWLELTR